MTKEIEVKPYYGKVSTAPDVKKLMEKWPDLKQGDSISHEDIENTIGEIRHTGRWVSVTNAWRRQLEQKYNLLLIADYGKGYRVADNRDRVTFSSNKAATGCRAIRRAAHISARTAEKGLTVEEKKTRQHLASLPGKLRLAELTAPTT